MAKILKCAKEDPLSGCQHIIRGKTKEEVLRKATEHAEKHGIRKVTPELTVLVKANMALLFLSRLSLWNSASEKGEEEASKSN
jgi:predicted small metal-binding protein